MEPSFFFSRFFSISYLPAFRPLPFYPPWSCDQPQARPTPLARHRFYDQSNGLRSSSGTRWGHWRSCSSESDRYSHRCCGLSCPNNTASCQTYDEEIGYCWCVAGYINGKSRWTTVFTNPGKLTSWVVGFLYRSSLQRLSSCYLPRTRRTPMGIQSYACCCFTLCKESKLRSVY